MRKTLHAEAESAHRSVAVVMATKDVNIAVRKNEKGEAEGTWESGTCTKYIIKEIAV